MGTIIFQLITGNVPFEGKNPFEVLRSILHVPIRFPADVVISDTCKSLICNLLRPAPEERYGWAQYFEHPFIKTKPEEYLLYLREIFGPNYGSALPSPVSSARSPVGSPATKDPSPVKPETKTKATTTGTECEIMS